MNKKEILIGAGVLAVIGGIGYYFFVKKKDGDGAGQQAQQGEAEQQGGGGGGGGGGMISGGDIAPQEKPAIEPPKNLVDTDSNIPKKVQIKELDTKRIGTRAINAPTGLGQGIVAKPPIQGLQNTNLTATSNPILTPVLTPISTAVSTQSVGGAAKLGGKTNISFSSMNKPTMAPRII